MRKVILITGSEGQLGNELRILSAQGFLSSFQFIFSDIVSSESHETTLLDITNVSSLDAFFSKNKIDFIINCAAFTAVDKAESEEEKATLLNATAPGFLAEMATKYRTKLIHVSTDYVFDGFSCVPYKEDHPVNPQSAYGKTKLAGETAVLQKCSDAVIIRTSWLYSSFGNNFVKTMLKYGRERGALKVVFDQAGSPTYAADLALAIMQIIAVSSSDETKFIPGIYHYSDEGVCSWYDFAHAILKFAGVPCTLTPIETKDYPLPAKRPNYSVFDKTKIKTAYGITIPHWTESLEVCLKKMNEKQ